MDANIPVMRIYKRSVLALLSHIKNGASTYTDRLSALRALHDSGCKFLMRKPQKWLLSAINVVSAALLKTGQ